MRHFMAYHNSQKMGYSCIDIPAPQAKTSKNILGLEGVTVWLIAGEGDSPKCYYLTSTFIADKCEQNRYIGEKLNNQISGRGRLLKKTIPISETPLLKALKKQSANFVNGFGELKDIMVIKGLQALA